MRGKHGGKSIKTAKNHDISIFLSKDYSFLTVIWPALIMGLNHANAGLDTSTPVSLPGPGDLKNRT